MTPASPVIPGTPEITIAEHQPEYENLPAVKLANGDVVTRWKMTWADRFRALLTGDVFVILKTFNQPLQPLMVQTEPPELGCE